MVFASSVRLNYSFVFRRTYSYLFYEDFILYGTLYCRSRFSSRYLHYFFRGSFLWIDWSIRQMSISYFCFGRRHINEILYLIYALYNAKVYVFIYITEFAGILRIFGEIIFDYFLKTAEDIMCMIANQFDVRNH